MTIAHLIYLSDNLFHSSSPLTGVWSLPGPDGTSLLNLVKLQPSAICSTKPTFWCSSKQPSNAPSFHPDGTAPPFQCYLQTKTWRLLLFIAPTAGTTRPIKGKMLLKFAMHALLSIQPSPQTKKHIKASPPIFHKYFLITILWNRHLTNMNIDCCQFWVRQVKVVAEPWVSIKPWQLCPLSLIASHNHTSPTSLFIFLPISQNIPSSYPANLELENITKMTKFHCFSKGELRWSGSYARQFLSWAVLFAGDWLE